MIKQLTLEDWRLIAQGDRRITDEIVQLAGSWHT